MLTTMEKVAIHTALQTLARLYTDRGYMGPLACKRFRERCMCIGPLTFAVRGCSARHVREAWIVNEQSPAPANASVDFSR